MPQLRLTFAEAGRDVPGETSTATANADATTTSESLRTIRLRNDAPTRRPTSANDAGPTDAQRVVTEHIRDQPGGSRGSARKSMGGNSRPSIAAVGSPNRMQTQRETRALGEAADVARRPA